MSDLPADFPARVRAANAYSGAKNRDEFGTLIGVSGTTVKNYETGTSKPEERSIAETIKRLSRASKLPEWFFTVPRLDSMRLGSSGANETEQRLSQIEDEIRALRAEITTAVAEATRQIEEAMQPILDSLPEQPQ